MRLTDLLHPHLDGITSVVDATDGGLRLEPYLHLPPGIELRRHEQPVGEGELVLLSYGPQSALHGDEADCRAVLERMRPGGRGLIVFGHPGPELPYHRLLDSLVAHNCQVLRAAALDYAHLHAGAVFACTDELLPPHDWFGRPVPAEGLATALRIAGEYVLADLVSRSLRARLLDLEDTAEETARALDAVRQDGLADRLAAAVREKEQLSSALRRARGRVGVLEARVAMLEGSTSLRVGKALVTAARSPKRGAVRLPGELYGMWRQRKGKGRKRPAEAVVRPQSAVARPQTAREPDLPADDRLHLTHRALSVGPRDRLVITGVLTDRAAEDFAADAVVSRVLPHDGHVLLERTDPDAFVVQLSACAGPDGPWSLTGTALAPDLDRRLAELVGQARASGRPAVLWRDGPAACAPGLAQLAWDAVIDADAGVRLSRLDPVADGRERLREAFAQDSTRVRLARLARLVGAPDPLDRRRVAVLAAPGDRADVARLVAQALGQLHRPAEVVVPDPKELDELTAAGVAVHTGPPTAPWIADWSDLSEDRPDTLLLDLMCAQEYSGADAVGHTPAADDYAFVPVLRPLLVRRSLLMAGAPPDTWSREGYRLFAVRGKEPS
ncbi:MULTISPECIES: hypothetical protein [Streptomyces]|uniref:Uncharacterized protein n=1 Tax=Streptomyces dengpaensis TaxID=2049881 RepID=A0ABM6SMC9_9ACTN|nr:MULTISPECIES: hypothetical protein [Streptomyces]AVH55327.1 hypothetical protein C4B68_05465 [Streptomyces dengpaensis]PIB06971.1 hypothetical protein B1C81_21615 [Streptomyces sp. HG99]